MFDYLFPHKWSTLKKLLILKATALANKIATFTGSIVRFITSTSRAVEDCLCTINPVQSGSGDPSPDNVRPITGFTGLTVWDDPKYGGNIVWNQLIQNGNFANTSNWYNTNSTFSVSNNVCHISNTHIWGRIKQKIYDSRVSGHKYLLSVDVKADSDNAGKTVRIILSKEDTSDEISTIKVLTTDWQTMATVANNTFTSEGWIQIGGRNNTVEFDAQNAQCFDLTQMFGAGNEPSTVEEFKALFPKDYYAYNTGEITCVSKVNGDSYREVPISWQSEAGTVYGGTLDVVSGVLTVDRVKLGPQSFTEYAEGSNSTTDWLNVRFVFPTTIGVLDGNISSNHPRILATAKSNYTGVWAYANANGKVHWYSSTFAINAFYPKSSFPTFEDFQTYYGQNGAEFVLPLAEPQTYQLTGQQIETLAGENVMFHDANGEISVTVKGGKPVS